MIYLDTHVAAWLYARGREMLSERATELIEANSEIRISPMVRLELQYLFEIGRVGAPALSVIDTLQSTLGMSVCNSGFPAVILEAEGQRWTRDPFDRIIVAQAALHDAPLLTKDETIQRHYGRAVW